MCSKYSVYIEQSVMDGSSGILLTRHYRGALLVTFGWTISSHFSHADKRRTKEQIRGGWKKIYGLPANQTVIEKRKFALI